MITVSLIPVLKDNYSYLLEGDDGTIGIVDPGEPSPVDIALKERNLSLDYIFNTHHHGDHVAGNGTLKKKYSAKLIGPAAEQNRIPNLDVLLEEDDEFEFSGEQIKVIETPGHTSGHVCFWFPESKALFCGDALFSMGCGRLFEGTAEQLFDSLAKLQKLPDDTKIYCGHEYTLANGKFCQTVEPGNKDIQARMEEVKKLRANDLPTIPSTMGLEKKTNVFLRALDARTLAEYRAIKDDF